MPSIITTSSLPLPLLLLLLLLLLAPSPAGAAFKNSNKNTFDFSDRDTKDDWSSSGTGKGGKNSGGCSVPGGHLKVGQSQMYKKHQENCTMLLCEKDGLNSVLAQCYAPECHDARMKGDKACCATCPNGRNCLLPDKTVLWGDNVTRVGNTLCRCPKIRTGLGWGDRLGVAQCHVITTPAPTTTTPVPHCRLPQEKAQQQQQKKKAQKGAGKEEEEEEEEELLAPGKEAIVPKDDNCRKYVCNAGGQLTTYYGKCPALNCTNATREIGECCRVCPDDVNATSEPISYSTHPPHQRRKVVYIDFFTLLRMLLFGQSHRHHHHHHHHHHHNHHSSSSKTKTSSGSSGGQKSASTSSSSSTGAQTNNGGQGHQSFFMIFSFGHSSHHSGNGQRSHG